MNRRRLRSRWLVFISLTGLIGALGFSFHLGRRSVELGAPQQETAAAFSAAAAAPSFVTPASPTSSQQLALPEPRFDAPRWALHALTDRPAYKPNEDVRVTCWLLRARDQAPVGADAPSLGEFEATVSGPKGDVVRQTRRREARRQNRRPRAMSHYHHFPAWTPAPNWLCQMKLPFSSLVQVHTAVATHVAGESTVYWSSLWLVPDSAAGGEYTLTVRPVLQAFRGGGAAAAAFGAAPTKRVFNVRRARQRSPLTLSLYLERNAYGAGDVARATLSAHRAAGGGGAAGAQVDAVRSVVAGGPATGPLPSRDAQTRHRQTMGQHNGTARYGKGAWAASAPPSPLSPAS